MHQGGYHHHQLEELAQFSPEVLRSPAAWRNRLQRRLLGKSTSPFPWLRIAPGSVR